jgi:molybdate transport system ATP-binding protein
LTLGLIAGLMRPDRGHVVVDGRPLVDVPRLCLPAHRRRIGLVFQDALLFPHMSVRANLLYGARLSREGTQRLDLSAVVETLGLGALLERRPGGLSGGERQRVAIGRAVLAAPHLLLMDEPLAALDRRRKLDILPLIERLRDSFGIPIVYVSHAVEEIVRLATHVVVLEAGRVATEGDPARVFGAQNKTVDEPRFGQVSVLDVRVGATDQTYGLTALHHPSGTLWMAGPTALAQGARARALVRATDVTVAAAAPGPTSIRSTLEGKVAAIGHDGPFASVDIALTGGGDLRALVTRQAVDALGLAPARPVHALIKTVALDEGALGPAG